MDMVQGKHVPIARPVKPPVTIDRQFVEAIFGWWQMKFQYYVNDLRGTMYKLIFWQHIPHIVILIHVPSWQDKGWVPPTLKWFSWSQTGSHFVGIGNNQWIIYRLILCPELIIFQIYWEWFGCLQRFCYLFAWEVSMEISWTITFLVLTNQISGRSMLSPQRSQRSCSNSWWNRHSNWRINLCVNKLFSVCFQIHWTNFSRWWQ